MIFFIIESLGRSQNGRFELTKNQLGTKKEPSKKAPNLNGGADAHRFELLVQNYYEHINSKVTPKICYLISSLNNVA